MNTRKKIISFCMVLFMALMLCSNEAYAAGSFSVSGGGSVSSGGGTKTITITATNCAGKFTVSASNGGSVSSSSVFIDSSSTTVTVTAPSSGSTTVTVTASDVTDYDGNTVSGSKSVTVSVSSSSSSSGSGSSSDSSSGSGSSSDSSSGSGSSSNSNSSSSSSSSSSDSTDTEEEETKSSNNNLSALSVSDGTLSPEFSASTTSYTVNVTDIDSITISATKADTTASISGTGEKELTAGVNEFSVVVTAEDGTKKTYNIAVTLVETPTAFATYEGEELGAVKDISGVTAPDGFDETTVTLGGEEITAWSSNLLGITVVYMIDDEGNTDFYMYDETAGELYEFRPLGLLGRNIYVMNISEEDQVRSGMVYQLLTIEGNEIWGWAFEDEALSDYFVIYVMSDTGQMVNYLYCESDSSMILAPEMAPVSSETYEALILELENSAESVSTISTEQEETTELLTYVEYIGLALAILSLILLIVIIILSVKVRKLKKAANRGKIVSHEDEDEELENYLTYGEGLQEDTTYDDKLEEATTYDDELEEDITYGEGSEEDMNSDDEGYEEIEDEEYEEYEAYEDYEEYEEVDGDSEEEVIEPDGDNAKLKEDDIASFKVEAYEIFDLD